MEEGAFVVISLVFRRKIAHKHIERIVKKVGNFSTYFIDTFGGVCCDYNEGFSKSINTEQNLGSKSKKQK